MGCKRLERILAKAFLHYGHLVDAHPLLFFIVPLSLSLLLTPCLFLLDYDHNVILLFTPYDAPSRHELKIYNEFSLVQPLITPDHLNRTKIDGQKSELLQIAKNDPRANPWIFIAVYYADHSNIMTSDTWANMSRVIDFVFNNFTCQVHSSSQDTKLKTRRYNPDFCDPENPSSQCLPWNKYVKSIQGILSHIEHQSDHVDQSDHSNKSHRSDHQDHSNVKLTYPIITVWNQAINWGQFIHGVQINQTDNRLLSAKAFDLKLDFQFSMADNGEFEARQCMSQLKDYIISQSTHNGLHFYMDSEWFLNEQVDDTSKYLLPYIIATVILVTLFTVFSSYYSRAPVVGLLESLLGVLTIGLSLLTSLSITFACGLQYNFIAVMMPFLVLCVGIDNDFLLMSAWRSTSIEKLLTRERLARAFVNAGPNLTVTSVNDILCFAVGACFSESPAIAHFCLFTCVALAFRFLYQLTFFAGGLLLINEHRFCDCKLKRKLDSFFHKRQYVEPTKTPDLEGEPAKKSDLNSDSSARASPERLVEKFFSRIYSSIISKRPVRVFVTALFVLYLALAGLGASQLKIDISLRKLIPYESPMQEYLEIGELYVMETQIGNVIVTRAPDFRKPGEVEKFLDFVDTLESTSEYSLKTKDTTSLWLRDYIEYQKYFGSDSDDFFAYLEEFLKTEENKKYIRDLRFYYSPTGQLNLKSFRFTTYYQNLSTWDDSVKLLLQWRSICANYSQYGAIVQDYTCRNTYLDQRLTLSRTTLQTMGIASLMIAVVTCLLMPDATSMFFICFSSLSVDLGVIGALNACGSDLDPVTMACLLMTIGFSVYYTARMCYCYQRSSKNGSNSLVEKLSTTLGSVGWPILQGGLGTLVGSLPLAFIRSYMIRTFFLTIVLVVGVGLLHGLVFIPVMMSLYDQQIPSFRKYRRMHNV